MGAIIVEDELLRSTEASPGVENAAPERRPEAADLANERPGLGVELDDEKVERILQYSPPLKEDGSEEPPAEKPTQRSGLGKRPGGYKTKADWYRAKLS